MAHVSQTKGDTPGKDETMSTQKTTKKTPETETKKATKKAPNAKATEAPTTPALPPTMPAKAPTGKPPAKAPAPAKDAKDRPLFRPDSATAVLFKEGSKDWIDRKALVEKVAKMTGKESRLVEFMLMWMRQPAHPTNRGRFTIEKNEGKQIRIVALRDAPAAKPATATAKTPKAAKPSEKKA